MRKAQKKWRNDTDEDELDECYRESPNSAVGANNIWKYKAFQGKDKGMTYDDSVCA